MRLNVSEIDERVTKRGWILFSILPKGHQPTSTTDRPTTLTLLRRNHNETTLAESLKHLMAHNGVTTRQRAQQAVAQWPALAGAPAAAASLGFQYRRGVLRVTVSGAVWVQELGMRRTELLVGLNAAAGAPVFTGLEFVG